MVKYGVIKQLVISRYRGAIKARINRDDIQKVWETQEFIKLP